MATNRSKIETTIVHASNYLVMSRSQGDAIAYSGTQAYRNLVDATDLLRDARNNARPKRQTAKQAAFYFFLKNAGYSYDPKTETPKQGRARCARELAKAERDARALGYSFEWVDDECIGCDCDNPECECSSGEPHESLCCIIRDENGRVAGSLGSICKPSREYARVVEAEVASEALAER
jgi:hypothetical protein